MDSEEGKIFIGGIAWDTTEDTLRDHFGQYGEVTEAVIMRDKTTGRPRGFGFFVFSDPSIVDSVLRDPHNIDGRLVDAKKALWREQHNPGFGNNNAGRNFGGQNRTIQDLEILILAETLEGQTERKRYLSEGYLRP